MKESGSGTHSPLFIHGFFEQGEEELGGELGGDKGGGGGGGKKTLKVSGFCGKGGGGGKGKNRSEFWFWGNGGGGGGNGGGGKSGLMVFSVGLVVISGFVGISGFVVISDCSVVITGIISQFAPVQPCSHLHLQCVQKFWSDYLNLVISE